MFATAGAAAAFGGTASLGLAGPAAAHGGSPSPFPMRPAPLPIPFTAGPTGAPAPFDFIHWTLPGPVGATTPINGLASFGLDVHRSSIWNYDGYTTYAVISGTAESNEGPRDVELDIRVMQGTYEDDSGARHEGTFGFF